MAECFPVTGEIAEDCSSAKEIYQAIAQSLLSFPWFSFASFTESLAQFKSNLQHCVVEFGHLGVFRQICCSLQSGVDHQRIGLVKYLPLHGITFSFPAFFSTCTSPTSAVVSPNQLSTTPDYQISIRKGQLLLLLHLLTAF